MSNWQTKPAELPDGTRGGKMAYTSHSQCVRCARHGDCGKTFEPHIDYGECGHCDGCADFEECAETEGWTK